MANFTVYDTLASTNSNAINLINYAMSYSSFRNADYVCFEAAENDFYIVWGDLKVAENESVSGSKVEYIRYFRSGSSGYTNYYSYDAGTFDTFNLAGSDYVYTTNLANGGFVSSLVGEYQLYNTITSFLILAVAIIFAIMIKVFRSSKA